MLSRASLPIIAALLGASVACLAIDLSPIRYTASAAVLLPDEPASKRSDSRVIRIRESSPSASFAAETVKGRLAEFRARKAHVLDDVLVLREAPDRATFAAAGGLAGLAVGIALLVVAKRRRRPVVTEADFTRALGQPLLAARPLRIEGIDDLCRQLLEHWFTPQRRLLPVVSAETGEGRTSVAVEMAKRFAGMGLKVLLVDADLRSPSLHKRFGLPNRAGLGDFLSGRGVSIAACGENLGIIVAGACSDTLDALSSPRFPAMLVEAGKHFQVILVDTPAAARGPDLQMPAALAGGALVVARPGEARGPALERLHATLEFASARVVATLVNRS